MCETAVPIYPYVMRDDDGRRRWKSIEIFFPRPTHQDLLGSCLGFKK